MKIGVISSSGGSVIVEVYKILQNTGISIELFVVVDRDCGIQKFCQEYKVKCIKIVERDNDKFSKLASDFFSTCGGVDFVLLFFLRLVTNELHKKFPTINIHPSLLPSFKGFNSIEKAVKEDVKFFGASMHLVDDSVDGGKLIGQVIAPLVTNNFSVLKKISFLQKTYLVLLMIDLYINKSIEIDTENSMVNFLKKCKYNFSANPAIVNISFNSEFNNLMEKEGINIFQL